MDKTIGTVKINWDTLGHLQQTSDSEYNKETDILFIYSKKKTPAISIDCDGEYWLRVEPRTGEILGIEIEDFKRVFLKKHPEIIREKTSYVGPIVNFIQLEKCSV